MSFIGSEKRVLYRCLREHDVALTAEAQARRDALPESFVEFLAGRTDPIALALRRAA